MCGIAGLLYDAGRREAAMAAVRRMIAVQRHRGPEGGGLLRHDWSLDRSLSISNHRPL